jgi:hypothetical protein
MGAVSSAFSIPGGRGFAVAAPLEVTGALAVGVSFAGFSALPHAAISAEAAVAPTPMSASLRMASRRDISPSTWSVAISSAM